MKLFKKFKSRANKVGTTYLLLGIIFILRNYLLRLFFNFQKWHVSSNFFLHPYKSIAVDLVNLSNPITVLEIGCGLGDIILRTKSQKKIGIDPDKRVLQAAKTLGDKSNIWIIADLSSAAQSLKKYNITAVDTLIMINWPHTLPLKSICSAVKELKNVVDLKYLVIDLIRENANGYQYKHRTFDLQIMGRIESIKDGGDGLREIVLVKLL